MAAPAVLLEKVHKTFFYENEYMEVLKDVSLRVGKGEFVSILGPSGCGKSTLLKIIPGLIKADRGEIVLEGQSIADNITKVGYMPQKDLLAPWKTLVENIALPLVINGQSKKDAYQKVKDLLPDFGLEGFDNYYPQQLSGGMKQRAALMRTVLIGSTVLLLDEPFGALDALTRENMQEWLLGIWGRFNPSILFITHSIDEAIYLSDKVYVMSQRPGRIVLEQNINLIRPRSRSIVTTDEFIQYKKILIESLK